VLKYPRAEASLQNFPYSNAVVSGDLVAIASQVPSMRMTTWWAADSTSKLIRCSPIYGDVWRPAVASMTSLRSVGILLAPIS
jgi:hypothetical protein